MAVPGEKSPGARLEPLLTEDSERWGKRDPTPAPGTACRVSAPTVRVSLTPPFTSVGCYSLAVEDVSLATSSMNSGSFSLSQW